MRLPQNLDLFSKFLAPKRPDLNLLEQPPAPSMRPLETPKAVVAPEPRVDLGHSTKDSMQPRLDDGFWSAWRKFLGVSPKTPAAGTPSSDTGQVSGQGQGPKVAPRTTPDLFDKVKAYKAFEAALGLDRGSTPEQVRTAMANASAQAASDPGGPAAAAIRELGKTVGTDALGSFERFIQHRSQLDANRSPAHKPLPPMPSSTIG